MVYAQRLGFCAETQLSCTQIFDSVAEVFQILIPTFALSLVVYMLHHEVFSVWVGFIKWFIPVTFILILLAPLQSHDWMFPIDKGRVSFGMTVVFVAVSIVLIAWKWFASREKQ